MNSDLRMEREAAPEGVLAELERLREENAEHRRARKQRAENELAEGERRDAELDWLREVEQAARSAMFDRPSAPGRDRLRELLADRQGEQKA
ncbi:hypothetical protein K1T35_47415 (plasmid) [Pseudonocardia sp. DSM 110487]|uniref:hypothetical protein n=1 Tax=Pseudonocardia sp. DSM 110487 TaxID=2865833 RepID=UPI001C699E5E|nr:hypothetical protein [Pseudonocardia sp. DSM 110487]QYN40979.1 hypothetical protein K1T35_47415 [Pseudonocardia sp. DSM 110487]